jgi:predicted membrane-bound spermidine synthase
MAASHPARRSKTSPATGTALSAGPARPTSAPTRTEAEAGAGASQARRLPPLGLLVFVTGVSTLGAEIAAARLMAPYFGASTIVWANTIAVVLVALSIGYWLGGRMADHRPDIGALCLLVLAASALFALVPILADPFLSLAFDDLALGEGLGSLLGVLALVSVPVLMLGAVSPWAIRLRVERVDDAGEVAGRIYALSTVGSLLGTFLSALVLIPLIGTQRSFFTFALVMAIVAALGLPRRWWLVPLAIAALFALPT